MMNSLKKLKIGTQLMLGFGLLTAFMLILATFSLVRVAQISDAFKDETRLAAERLEPLYAARSALANTGLAARNAFIFTDNAQAAKELAIVDEEKARYMAALDKMSPAFAGDAQFDKVKSGLLAMATALNTPRQLREAGKMDEFGKFLVNECSPLRRRIVEDIRVVVTSTQAEMARATQLSQETASNARTWISVLAAATLVLCVLTAILIKHLLLSQLGGEPAYAADIANQIAQGNLSLAVDLKSGDNSSLLFAISTMRDSLCSIVGQVRQGTDSIGSASGQIASGNHDLSERTAQQADSLERVATAMEELTSTVKQNADNALQANSLAQSASGVSEEGGAVMQQVTETMESINDSSKKIVDIISVIDGIAFQTNILALNAAVEAARAGEQGRGFAVVAAEVRNLAQRSAAAAKEIKFLIDDSVTKVSSGSDLVQKAGTTIHAVVASVKRVTEIMGEISGASAEQSIGIEQVNRAITDMDGMTQQNMALVEEASAAAQEMQSQASELANLVGVFKLDGAPVAQASAPAKPQRSQARKQGAGMGLLAA